MATLEKVNLFWDIDPKTLDTERHRRFIIGRILARGDLDDFAWAKTMYSESAIKDVVCTSRSLDKRSINFWQNYFQITSQVCTPRSSNQAQGAFWTK